MKKFKIIDYWMSIALIIVCTVAAVIARDIEYVILAYLVVGGWQVISMLVHVCTGSFSRHTLRNIYHIITLLALVTIPAGSFWLLIFAAPFMAIFYTWLCWYEVQVKMQRPMQLLK
ncbi:MAG TPA: hypothetical protein PKC39_07590 [Ferruginibacter sp.]|nr:hypothetical protein [Ferruginibacter sp.]HMP20806.1 hypothetical protein [Ferruginibacter sp.]